jgi:hypothetical protein
MKGLVKLSTVLVGATLATASFATNYCGFAVGNMPAGKCHMVMSNAADTRIDVPASKAEEAKYERKQAYKRAYHHHAAAKSAAYANGSQQ